MDDNNDASSRRYFNHRGAFLVVNRQVIPLSKEITTLGRILENDIVFHDDFLSRYHAEIILEANQFVLYDKNSTGGTYVNGKKINRCVLNSGDLIALVNIQIMFVDNTSNLTLVGKSTGMTQGLGDLHHER
jgi:pSer/pThr/pTyr-binding forkhead associated (FHA) protein